MNMALFDLSKLLDVDRKMVLGGLGVIVCLPEPYWQT